MLESIVLRLLFGGVIGLIHGQVSLVLMLWVLRKEPDLGASVLPLSAFLICYAAGTAAMFLVSLAEQFFDLLDDLDPLKMGIGVLAPLFIFGSVIQEQHAPLNKAQWFYLCCSALCFVLVAYGIALPHLPRRFFDPPQEIRRRELVSAWIETVPLRPLIWFFEGPAHMHHKRLLLRFGRKERRRELVEALSALVLVIELIRCQKHGLDEEDRPFAAGCYNLRGWTLSLARGAFLTDGRGGGEAANALLSKNELATLRQALRSIRKGDLRLRYLFENAGFKFAEKPGRRKRRG